MHNQISNKTESKSWRFRSFHNCLLLAGLMAAISFQAGAATYNWNIATGTAAWDLNGNWTTAGFPNAAGDVANLNKALTTPGVTITLGSSVTAGIITMNSSANQLQTLGVNGGNTITLNNNGAGAQINIGTGGNGNTIAAPIIIGDAGGLTITAAGGNSRTEIVSGGVSGTGNLTINDNRAGGTSSQFNITTGTINNIGTLTVNSSQSGTAAGIATLMSSIIGTNVTTLTKQGAAVLTLGGVNTYSGATTISAGTLRLNIVNAIPSTSSVDVAGILNLNGKSDNIGGLSGAGTVDATVAGAITLGIGNNNSGSTFSGVLQNTLGTLSLTKSGSGTQVLSGLNTYSGTTTINGGALTAGSAESPGSSGPFGSSTAAGSIVFGGGSLQYSPANLAYDYSSRFSTAASQPISIDTAGETVTFVTALTSSGGSLTKIGNGTLILTAAETYSGNTTINGGTLALSGSGALSAASTINIGAGATFDVSALGASATYTLGAGATLKASGTGMSAGTTAAQFLVGATGIVDLGAQPVSLTWGGASAGTDSTHPSLYVSQGTLNLNNNSITVIVPGTALGDGVYTLISAPAITGTPNAIPSFAGGNGLAPGKTGTISVSGSSVILTVSGSSAVLATWLSDVNGNWTAATNWSSNPNVPRNSGDVATLGASSSLRTITLNAAITNGTITFTNNNSFVIANGGSTLTLNNSGAGAAINVSGGTQNAIGTALALGDNTSITIVSNKSLSISGAIGNSAGAKTLTVSGGTLALSGNNNYGPSAGSVGTTLTGGTLQLGHNSALGAGDLNVNANSTLQAGAAGLSVGNNVALGLGVTETVDNNGNALTLGGVISGSGTVAKTGAGTLTLGGLNTYNGGTRITGGAVSVSTGGANPGDPSNLGEVPASPTVNNIILNGGDLLGTGTATLHANRGIGIGAVSGVTGGTAFLDAASGATFTINGSLASAGNGGVNGLTVNSLAPTPGTVVLGGANTFGGTTVIANGTLQLANSLALQNSSLNYNTGTLTFDSLITAATIGSLSGSQNLSLQNVSAAPVTLTIGGNNGSMNYGGNLTGPGSLTKAGTGTLIVSNANYSGGTTIFGGSGAVTIKGGSFGSSASPITVGASLILTNATFTTASTFNLATSGGQTGVGATIGGAANLTNTTTSIGSGANTAGGLNLSTTGNVNLGDVNINKNAGNVAVPSAGVGLVLNGANVIAASVNVAQSGTGARGADLNINSGTLTIADATQTGKFALHAGNGTAFLTMTGGTLNYLGTDGLLMSIGGGNSYASFNGGTANLTGITINSGGAAVTSILSVNGTNNPSLYLGSGGLLINLPSPTVFASFGNGTIGALADWSADAPITLTNNPMIKAADAANVAHSITLSNVLSGTGGFTKIGAGTLSLFGANTYTGRTVISNSVLALVADGAIGSSTNIAIVSPAVLDVTGRTDGTLQLGTGADLQTLSGNGTLLGNLNVGALGTLSPGFSIGTLTVSGSATLGGTTLIEINRAASPNSDRLAATTIAAGGTLTVTNIGAGLQVGDSFQLLSTPATGSFATLNLAANDTVNNLVYTWTNKLAINGTIQVLTVASAVNTNSTSLTNSFDGSNLTLTWPADHIGWRLEGQTNSLATGLNTNWVTIAGSTTTNKVVIPAIPSNGSVFYRLVYP